MTAPDLEQWERANRELIAKMITEFGYEEIVDVDVTDDGALTVPLPGATLTSIRRGGMPMTMLSGFTSRWTISSSAR